MQRMKANFMPKFRAMSRLLLTMLLAAPLMPAQALQADKSQPIQVEANAMHYNDVKQTSVFTGNVVVTKGTLVIHATRVEVVQTPQGYDNATAFGTPTQLATYAQTLDAQPGQPTPAMHGSAVTIQYDGKSDVVTFTGQATLDRLSDGKLTDRAQGQVITYNDLTDVFAVVGGKDGVTASNPSGRVRVMLSPRPAAQPAAKPSGPAPALKVSPGLGAKP
jgi:lipopolysaccharide export system protein LptA